ncbi:unnamed protein product [Bursaphelenchus okinawaensis]|uniref:Uncharacterized protein n=1 Tax=Bursaphelenchus okinawaensis TaxID=465554 RepID=A0A811L5C1_9BILA|nr:unnamed protein product [Bursaphelenchus okinawaensis]CAG9117498.1 unnamed protein product [Bursaphelenchus okinawaensis]
MPHGFEAFLGPWSYPTFMAPHSFAVIHGILILPALCHYRYLLITSGNTVSPWIILRNVFISFLAGSFLGICLGYGVYQASSRPYDHYFQFVTHEWIDADGTTPYRYACDMVS